MSTVQVFSRTALDIVAEVLMTRSAFTGAILLVEGSSDSRFLKRHLIASNSQLVICGGKQTLLSAMNQMSSLPISGCCAIIDRDFDDFRQFTLPTHTFYTDTHDLETLLLSLRLGTVIRELGDSTKLDNYRQNAGKEIDDSLLEKAEAFGKLRFLNEVRPVCGVNMDQLSPWKYISISTWHVDDSTLQQDFALASGYTPPQLAALLQNVPSLRDWRTVRGHDALAILSIGLREVLGNGKQVSEQQISSALRLAVSEADFQTTKLYTDLKHWQASIQVSFLAH